jgi:nucleoside-diphosphate-sugar epimerase
MRVAVTGATGFVGKALLPRLLADGHLVSALVRDPTAVLPDGVQVVRGGLGDEAALSRLVQGADVVLHIAGCISALNARDYFRTNVDGTIALAKAAVLQQVKRFVHVSSLAARVPKLGGYGASKAAAEQALQGFADDLQICVLRPSAVYGPGDQATLPLLKALMSRVAFIPGTQAARFSMIHVDDVAKVLLDAVLHSPVGQFELDDHGGGHTWHALQAVTRTSFGTPRVGFFIPRAVAMTLGWVADRVGQLRGKPWLTSTGQMRQIYYADWVVQGQRWPLPNPTSLHQGLPATIRWYQAQGLLPQRGRIDRKAPHENTKVSP